MNVRAMKVGLRASALSIAALLCSTTIAQVAPTEVNEEAVDDFGLERKTGRFVWSSGEIVGIGPEGGRIGIAANGIRTPPNGTTIIQGTTGYGVVLSQPRITESPMPKENPQFLGEIYPDKNLVTIEYSGGSHTFECTSSTCISQYLDAPFQAGGTPFGMAPSGNGYLFTDEFGTEILVEPGRSVTTYADGRQVTIEAYGAISNNFGFALKFSPDPTSGTRVTAVNQAVDYCVLSQTQACSGLDEDRYGRIGSLTGSTIDLFDAAGGQTRLTYVTKDALESRPYRGGWQPGDPSIRTITSRYLTGVRLPGSNADDVVITYDPHDPTNDTHDDIRVSSITKNGVQVDYEILDYWPFGKGIERPPQNPPDGGGQELSGAWGNGFIADVINNPPASSMGTCENVFPPVLHVDQSLGGEIIICSGSGPGGSLGGSGAGGGGGYSPPPPTYEEPPPDDSHPELYDEVGSQIYELAIKARIDGELVSISQARRPYSYIGMARRHLIFVADIMDDGSRRETHYYYDFYDQVAGVKLPEDNGMATGRDGRNNITSVTTAPKIAGGPTLVTLYTYEPDCTVSNKAWCNRPLTETDPMGNVTEFEYNQYGQLTKRISPAPEPGAARPTVVNEYEMRQAYIKDASGNPKPAGPPISMLVRSFTCISSATCDENTPAVDKVVTEYDYGPTNGVNNLLLRGIAVTAVNADGGLETHRTCYGYNYFGERISETLPSADLTSCPA